VNAASSAAPAFTTAPLNPRLARWLKNYPAWLGSERLHQSIELMERYSIDLAIDLLRQLDVLDQLGEWRSASELCHALSFQPRFQFALGWLLERLVETGCTEARTNPNARSYRLQHAPWQPELARLRRAGLNIDPSNAATLDLLDYAASVYPTIARCEQSGDQAMVGLQGVPIWLNFFHNNNLTYAVNNWAGAVPAVDRLSIRSNMRILEVGAGAGSASEALLCCFGERGNLGHIERYLITEPSAFFRRRAERELPKQYSNLPLQWGTLDINLPWDSQGIALGEFDLVYAVNVMHIAKDLFFSLNQARSALVDDGWLVIGECLRPYIYQPIYPELIFLIMESFTEVHTDVEIRPNPGFLTADQWRQAFRRAEFERVEVAPNVDNIRELYPHFFTGAICGQSATITKTTPKAFGASSLRAHRWVDFPERGAPGLLRLIGWIAIYGGRWTARLLLYPITLYFLICGNAIRRVSQQYLQRVRGRPAHWWHVFRHLYFFAATILDRIYLLKGAFEHYDVTFYGKGILNRQIENRKGCILLGSHLGSFEVLRTLGVTQRDLPLKVLMNIVHNENITRFFDAINEKIADTVIVADRPDTLLKVKESLDAGFFIGMLGDRASSDGRTTRCQFLGAPATFPAGPILLAASMHCPVILFFGLYRGRNRYEIHFEPFAERIILSRDHRTEDIQHWMQHYVERLEHYARLAPYNWFNFYPFWD